MEAVRYFFSFLPALSGYRKFGVNGRSFYRAFDADPRAYSSFFSFWGVDPTSANVYAPCAIDTLIVRVTTHRRPQAQTPRMGITIQRNQISSQNQLFLTKSTPIKLNWSIQN